MNRESHCIEVLGLDVKQKKINIRSHNICIKINEDKMQYALIFSKPREKNIDISDANVENNNNRIFDEKFTR